ncbi:uncharacterized protein V1518DRAFT_409281 [Limtongia smithiae]|uniref:uncharacterized protein n=1 Tax=Limtongia smithiae TaxID=1125753 RepID=UPI0034CDC3ED
MLSTAALPSGGGDGSRVTPARRDRRRGDTRNARSSRPKQQPKTARSRKDSMPTRYLQIQELLSLYPDSEIDEEKIHLCLEPSDPEFPFDLAALEFTLIVPLTYPESGDAPSIIVTNGDMPRGFALNVEHGFTDDISKPGLKKISLVDMITALDKHLETFLKAEKRATFKIVNLTSRKGKAEQSAYNDWGINPDLIAKMNITSDSNTQEKENVSQDLRNSISKSFFSEAEIAQATERRNRELRQLQTRLSSATRLPDDSATGSSSCKVPFQPARKSELPEVFQTVSYVTIVVPKLYDLEPCTIKFLEGDDKSSLSIVEENFKRHAEEKKEFSLLSHLNFLAQNVSLLLAPIKEDIKSAEKDSTSEVAEGQQEENYQKPPEWDMLDGNYSDDSDYMFDFDGEEETDYKFVAGPIYTGYDSQGHHEQHEGYAHETTDDADEDATSAGSDIVFKPSPNAVSITFPGMKLINVGVLQCTLLSLVVRCVRCKTDAEIRDIKPTRLTATPRSIVCGKCSSTMMVASFITELLFDNSTGENPTMGIRLGYIDLVGCTPVDLLASSFRPTCGECSEPLPGPSGITGLGLAQTMSTICRACHTRMSIYIPAVKFTRVSDDHQHTETSRASAKSRIKLGVVAGTPLPFNGTCQHYKRSTRWFRFSCCNRVFPCDKCHNDFSDHVDEHANKMICGMCSREQNYRPDVCAFCRHSFIRKSTGFWEGGKGTRDKVKMSRKDPRKYKRRT